MFLIRTFCVIFFSLFALNGLNAMEPGKGESSSPNPFSILQLPTHSPISPEQVLGKTVRLAQRNLPALERKPSVDVCYFSGVEPSDFRMARQWSLDPTGELSAAIEQDLQEEGYEVHWNEKAEGDEAGEVAALECRTSLRFASLTEGDVLELAPGISAIFLEYDTQLKNVVLSVGGFVLKLNRYNHGQARAWYFIANGVKYYAQGHYRGTDDSTIRYTVHPANSTSNIVHFRSYQGLEEVENFTEGLIHDYWYNHSESYKRQVDALL